MLAQGFVRNQGDGWTWTLDFLARAVEELAVTGREHEAATATLSPLMRAFADRHRPTPGASCTRCWREPADDPDFAPEPADEATLRAHGPMARIDQLDWRSTLLRAPARLAGRGERRPGRDR